ncbi:MAG TPA: DNA (cytosine-5-)-methyltransferase, partial [Methanosarcina sp.]|nr:DNA (cytosine-5-)-methyltransferase [Methanosarcina sp.]
MRIGTLFSGIGSPEQAAQRVWDNSELVFACEWDKFARQSFKANYEIAEEHFHKDINDMDGHQYAGKVNIIVGGSPCQDFSIAGLRAGVDGHRGQLIWQYFRIINEVRPPVFIYENVKGMISDKGGNTIQDFLEVFRSIG